MNVQLLTKHLNDTGHDYRRLKNDVIWFTENQMKPSDSSSITGDKLPDFNINFDNNDDRFLSSGNGYHDATVIIKKVGHQSGFYINVGLSKEGHFIRWI